MALSIHWGFPRAPNLALTVKNLPAVQRPGFDLWVGKMSWRREWLPTPVFLPGKSHGQRTLAGYILWGCKELVMTEQLILSFSIHYFPLFQFYYIISQKSIVPVFPQHLLLGRLGHLRRKNSVLFPNLEKWPNKFEFPIASFILSLANAKGKSADFVISLGKKDQ